MTSDRRMPPVLWAAASVLRPLFDLAIRRDWQDVDKLQRAGGFVIAGNHTSGWDPFAFGHVVYGAGIPPRFLAKQELFRVPVLGQLLRWAEQIPVHRGTAHARDALASATGSLERGRPVIVFPEGTYTTDPELWPMAGRSGAVRMAHATGCEIVPLACWGTHEVLYPRTRRFRLWPRRTLHLKAGDPVDLGDFREQPLTADSIERATAAVMRDLTALLEDLRGETRPVSGVTRGDPGADRPLSTEPGREADRAAGRDSAGPDSAGRDSADRDSAGRDSAGRDSESRR